MRIAVISDTHDRVPPQLPALVAGADAIWHLGDVCSPSVLDDFIALGKPLRVVRGNCDMPGRWPLVDAFEQNGSRIHLVHIPPDAAPLGTDILLHGHTHVPRNERVGDTLFLNPGCISMASRGAPPSFAWLTIERGNPPAWELVHLG